MLVIDRRQGESIWIGDDIYIKVLEIGRYRIKVGITAPGTIPIARDELTDRQPPKVRNV